MSIKFNGRIMHLLTDCKEVKYWKNIKINLNKIFYLYYQERSSIHASYFGYFGWFLWNLLNDEYFKVSYT